MNKAQAQIELNKINKTIEVKIVEHKNELGRHNKNCVEQELELLWSKKAILSAFVNG